MAKEFYGKYRAIVTNINDPEKRGRIKVKCPYVTGDNETGWCEACVPFGEFSLPALNEGVWVEFEHGDVCFPVYVGYWFAKDEIPTTEQSGKTRVIYFNENKIIMNEIVRVVTKDKTTVDIKGNKILINGSEVALYSQLHFH